MAQILVPGVAQAKLQGTISGHTWVCIWHYQRSPTGGTWSPGDLGSLASSLFSGWGTYLKVLFPANTILQSVSTVDIGTTAPSVGQSAGTPIAGTLAGAEFPPQCTTNVKFLINQRYRGGHPRSALPAMGGAQANATEDSWTAAAVGQMNTAFANLQDGAFAAVQGIFQVVPRYNYSYAPDSTGRKIIVTRESLKTPIPQVLNWNCQSEIGTQRRRNSVGG